MSSDPQVEHQLPTLYSQYIHATRYARWRDEDERRETWQESVDRYGDWFSAQCDKSGHDVSDEQVQDVRDGIGQLMAMPSMRCLMTAGKALEKDAVAAYNCAYVAVDHPRAFDESMYILMCGTGIGFSVERQYVGKLPEVPEELYDCDTVIAVPDSRVGWASGFKQLLHLLWSGHIPQWDLSRLRPAGARLKTFGGRSSGPAVLDDLFHFTVELFKAARGRRLTSLECHSLMCKVGEVVVAGGTRRSALISLSNPSDARMRDAKTGQWWESDPHFRLANNSAVWTDTPDPGQFLDEWTALYKSRSGERGIIHRKALQDQASRYGRRDPELDYGVNPCSEIILRPQQFCNLTTTVVRPEDDLNQMREKVKLATIMGCVQSTVTDFRYLRPLWRRNCEEERLLGVSMTGISDHPVLSQVSDESADWYTQLREYAVATAEDWSGRLGINMPAGITCVKPEGTASQLVGTGSGLHRRKAPFYLRRTRDSKMDPITELLRLSDVPCEEDVADPNTWVFTWPHRSPAGAATQEDETALDQLKLWLHVNDYWCEHKPSITINYSDDEVLDIGAFVYKNFNRMSGISFLPRDGGVYQQAPFETVDEKTYNKIIKKMPERIQWEDLILLEKEDGTTSSRELACTALGCEL